MYKVWWRDTYYIITRRVYVPMFGGVTTFTRAHYLKVNGFSNTFYGWGGEDDDMRLRCVHGIGIREDRCFIKIPLNPSFRRVKSVL